MTKVTKLHKKTGISLMSYVVKPTTAAALKDFPIINSSLQKNREIIMKKCINIGIAVAIENGLLVPVVHDADKTSLQELADELENLIQKAKDGSLEFLNVKEG